MHQYAVKCRRSPIDWEKKDVFSDSRVFILPILKMKEKRALNIFLARPSVFLPYLYCENMKPANTQYLRMERVL